LLILKYKGRELEGGERKWFEFHEIGNEMKNDEDFDLSIIWFNRRYLGIRIGIAGFLFSSLAFALACFGYAKLGMSIFVFGVVLGWIGFFVHLSRIREEKELK
jgi:hypothetical protein